MGLGLRHGQLPGVMVRDVNFRGNEVLVARRTNDQSDPRAYHLECARLENEFRCIDIIFLSPYITTEILL